MKRNRPNIDLFTVILYTILTVFSAVNVVSTIVNKSYNDSVAGFVADIVFTVCWSFLSVDGFMLLRRIKKEEKSTADSTSKAVSPESGERLILRKGCRVPFPEKLREGYEISAENRITANVSADKIAAVMTHFISMHREPLFFILELPTNLNDETKLRPGALTAFHKDVYYIDGCTQDSALSILEQAGKLAIDDGMCEFGFGCHESRDEIMFGKYNITTVFTAELARFDGFFEKHGIGRTGSLLTAWGTFSKDHPGECIKIMTGSRDVYSLVDEFADRGIYKAEQRED